MGEVKGEDEEVQCGEQGRQGDKGVVRVVWEVRKVGMWENGGGELDIGG